MPAETGGTLECVVASVKADMDLRCDPRPSPGFGRSSRPPERTSTSLLRRRPLPMPAWVPIECSESWLMLARACGRRASGTSSSSSELDSSLLSFHALGFLLPLRIGLTGDVGAFLAEVGESVGRVADVVGVLDAFEPVGVGGTNASDGARMRDGRAVFSRTGDGGPPVSAPYMAISLRSSSQPAISGCSWGPSCAVVYELTDASESDVGRRSCERRSDVVEPFELWRERCGRESANIGRGGASGDSNVSGPAELRRARVGSNRGRSCCGSPTAELPIETSEVVERERAEAMRNCSALIVGEAERSPPDAGRTLSGGRGLYGAGEAERYGSCRGAGDASGIGGSGGEVGSGSDSYGPGEMGSSCTRVTCRNERTTKPPAPVSSCGRAP